MEISGVSRARKGKLIWIDVDSSFHVAGREMPGMFQYVSVIVLLLLELTWIT